MSTNVTKFKTLYANSTATPQAIVNGTENNVIVVSGMNSNDILKFEVSVDGGTTWVEDDSLQFEADGSVTLENVSAIIKVKVDGVADTSNLKVLLGY